MSKLTKTICDAATYPAEKGPNGYHVVWDQQMPGFGLRCNPGGSKVFVCRYRAGRRQRLMKLGHYPVLTVNQARQLAREVLVQVYRGIDPLEERRREERRAITLAKLWDRYLEDYAKPHYKPRTLREVKGAWRRYLKNSLGSISVEEISRDDVARLQAKVYAASGNYAANDAIRLLRRLLAQAEQWRSR